MNSMRFIKAARVLAIVVLGVSSQAQVLSPSQIADRAAQRLQQEKVSQLSAIATVASEHTFPYPFYFSRVLDIDEKHADRADQRSIRFDRLNGKMVLAMTGNYYVSYAADHVTASERIRHTMDEVVRPLLQAAAAHFENDDSFDAYAFEIAHHVRHKVMGVVSESAENVVYVFPRAAAQHMLTATRDDQLQAALLESEIYLNAEPFSLWVNGDRPKEESSSQAQLSSVHEQPGVTSAPQLTPAVASDRNPAVAASLLKPSPMPVRLVLPQTLSSLKLSYAEKIARLQRDLDAQAHFVPYAPPEFIGFHQAAFLELSISTHVDAETGASQYKLAGLAFDDHISHLIRPVLAYFQESNDFDGLVFSTTVQQPGKSTAIEFFFPFSSMKCYAQYDCTGQQLIDSAFVLINGERASLNLQTAASAQVFTSQARQNP
jgi:hypothetical protein